MFDRKIRLNKRLLRAAKHGDEVRAAEALAQGAEIDFGRDAGRTPLINAIRAGKWSMACLLVEKGADVQGVPAAQKTPLIHAVEQGNAAIVRLLLEAGAAPDAIHAYTTTHTYERQNDDSGVLGFFKETSYYTRQMTHQLTALTVAAHNGNSEIVRLLLDAGARKDLCGKDGFNALQCAQVKGHPRVAALLQAAPEPKPAAEPTPKTTEARADEIVFQRPLGECFLEEIFDFTARERVSLIRTRATGPVEIATREKFEALAETPSLRAAFDEHVRRGGTAAEKEIFAGSLDKPRLNTPRSGFS